MRCFWFHPYCTDDKNRGLGVGVAAQSFISHGINTTIVEIDPAVYQYAREYFNLPEPNAIYLEDVRNWLQRPMERDKFDYVIHDCFSGGGVPQHIYTVEFWESLKRVMKPDGVIAVVCSILHMLATFSYNIDVQNFAGRLATEPARAILLTLQHSFANCRAYHDHQEAEFDESYTFFNIVSSNAMCDCLRSFTVLPRYSSAHYLPMYL